MCSGQNTVSWTDSGVWRWKAAKMGLYTCRTTPSVPMPSAPAQKATDLSSELKSALTRAANSAPASSAPSRCHSQPLMAHGGRSFTPHSAASAL